MIEASLVQKLGFTVYELLCRGWSAFEIPVWFRLGRLRWEAARPHRGDTPPARVQHCNTATLQHPRFRAEFQRLTGRHGLATPTQPHATPYRSLQHGRVRQYLALVRQRCKLSLIAALSIVNALDWEILKLPWTIAAGPSRDRSIPHEGPRIPLPSPAPFLSQIPPEAKMRHAVQAG